MSIKWERLKRRWKRFRHGSQAADDQVDEELGDLSEPAARAASAAKDETQTSARPVDQTSPPQSNATPSSADLTVDEPRGELDPESQLLVSQAFPYRMQSIEEVIQRTIQQNQQQSRRQSELQEQQQRGRQDRHQVEFEDQRQGQFRNQRPREVHFHQQRELPSQHQSEHQGQQRCGYQDQQKDQQKDQLQKDQQKDKQKDQQKDQQQDQQQNYDANSEDNEGPVTPTNTQEPATESLSDKGETA
jgi:phage-related minor tail protein